ncbi:bifunctional riboflavin kinase/FAD synthetase, partial [Candidatus Poribacteria bacterium]|nr:bifunctional riboflavin kinase/FAD synthetase [Candidatus Poribacteria bacterium]
AIRVKLENQLFDGVLNIGVRPTFNGTKLQVESHLFDFNKSIYGETIEIFFIEKIRNELTFSNKQALIQQIRRDIAVANEILDQ